MSVSESAVAQLRATVSGPVYVRGEEGYEVERQGFNTLSPNNPDLIFVPADEAEVQAAVRWAAANGTTVHPYATGHGAYRTLDHGLLLKTKSLDHITVDAQKQQWTMGAGLRWMQILPHLFEAGLGAVTGSAKTVGAVGLSLGGGIGPLGRRFGMAGDYVVGYRLVVGSGEVLVVDKDSYPDLFWALRGGKVGLGVVTEITFQALPIPYIYGGGIYYPESEMDRLAHAWLDWIQGKPEEVNTSIAFFRLPPEVPVVGGRSWFHFRFAYAQPGASQEELKAKGEAYLEDWYAVAGRGEHNMIEVLPITRVGEIHQEPEGPVPLWEYGDFLKTIDHDFMDFVLGYVGTGREAPIANLEIRWHDGAYTREPEPPTSMGGRKEPFTILVLGHPDETVPGNTWADVERVGYAIRDGIEPWRGAYVNYNWANHPSKETFESRLWEPQARDRLKEIRAKYDPQGIFEHGN